MELMEDYLPISKPSMTSENLIAFKKFQVKEPFVIYFGVIPMKDSVLMSVLVALAGLLGKIIP